MTDNVSTTLNLAADLIEERGWIKGMGWNHDAEQGAPLCLEGGIMAALGMRLDILENEFLVPLWTCPAYRAVADYLDRNVTLEDDLRPAQALYWWNDSQRDMTEVIEVLRATAVIEAAREAECAATPVPSGLGGLVGGAW